MNNHLAEQIARDACRFFNDYEVPHDVITADERRVHIVLGWATFKRHGDSTGYEVTLWNQGQKEVKNFQGFWDAVFCARDWDQERRENGVDLAA